MTNNIKYIDNYVHINFYYDFCQQADNQVPGDQMGGKWCGNAAAYIRMLSAINPHGDSLCFYGKLSDKKGEA